MAWGKIKLFYETMLGKAGSTLSATSTESTGDHDVDYIYNMLEINNWQAEDAGIADPQYLTFDAGAGNAYSADYLVMSLTNLFTAGVTVTLQNSNDNFAADINDIAAVRPTEDSLAFDEITHIVNHELEVWSYGTSAAPDGWYGQGSITIAREASIVKSGLYSAKITRSGSNISLSQLVGDYTYFKGKSISVGVWIYGTVLNQARVGLYDGVSTSYSGYHTNATGWEFLTLTKTISGSATELRIKVDMYIDGNVFVDEAVLVEASNIASTDVNDYIQTNSNAQRHWRLKIAGHGSTAPYAALAIWGNKTELDWAQASFDPNAERVQANITKSYAGYLTGIHRRSSERSFDIRFDTADAALYAKIKTWWDASGINNIFVGWNTKDSPDEVWLMRPDTTFNNPFLMGGVYRSIRLRFKGRKA